MLNPYLMKSIALAAILTLAPMSMAGAEVVYNRGNAGEPQTLDPHKTSTVVESHILRDMYEGLVEFDAKANVIPAVAESWTTSPDAKTWTFKLRSDAKWSNGDPVTAQDFVYSWQRILDPKTASKYATILYIVKGAEEINTKNAAPDTLGVKAVDPLTFEVTLKGPTPYFMEMLTHHSTHPVHKATIEKYAADWLKPENLVTNGAYVLKINAPHDKVQLVKNAKFREADSVKIDTVNYLSGEDRSTALKRFEAGELDSNDDVPAEQMGYIRDKFKGEFFSGPYLGTYYYSIRTDKAPFNNPKLRRALSLMVDREYLAEKIWGGTMIAAYSVVPPGIKGYNPSEADYKTQSPLDREDEARKIMTELGYSTAKPLKLEIRYNTSENHRNTAVAIADMMKPYGVEASLINTDSKTHYAHLQDNGDFDVARAGWIADYKDPQSFVQLTVTGDGHNYSKYSNPDYDKLVASAEVESDVAKRTQMLQQAEAITLRDTSMLILLHYSYKNLISKRLKGFEPNVMDIHPTRWMTKTAAVN